MAEADPSLIPKRVLRVFERKQIIVVVEEYDEGSAKEVNIVVNSIDNILPRD